VDIPQVVVVVVVEYLRLGIVKVEVVEVFDVE